MLSGRESVLQAEEEMECVFERRKRIHRNTFSLKTRGPGAGQRCEAYGWGRSLIDLTAGLGQCGVADVWVPCAGCHHLHLPRARPWTRGRPPASMLVRATRVDSGDASATGMTSAGRHIRMGSSRASARAGGSRASAKADKCFGRRRT